MTDTETKQLQKFNDFIDNLNPLTLFQKDFIKEMNYFIETKGDYIYMKSVIESKYENILTPKDINKDIEQLIKLGYIKKTLKKIIYNGRYSTRVYLEFK